MSNDTPAVDEHPAPAAVEFLGECINAYNRAATGIPFDGEVAIFLRDESDAIIAGLYGWIWGGCLDIRYLWVREDHRGQGHGTRLLAAAEAHARARGCHQALLDTHSFQAPLFYQRRGYAVFGTLDGYPRGHQKYYLKKNLP
jgi:GNAT superfamily N-acetyltransferase